MKQRAPRRNGTAVVPWESVPDLMYRVRGADGAIELLSAAFTTHTGWPVADWIGRPFSELVLAEDLPRATDRYTAILRGEKPTRSEMRIRTKAGGFVIGEFHGAPYVERGRVVGEQGIAREITDRRRRGEAREFGEERFRTLFESMDEALFLMDGPVFVDINPRGLEMFGLRDRSDIIGHSPVDFSPPLQPDGRESRERALAYILAALQGCPQRFYWQHARQDGTTFDAEVALHALTLHGRVHVQATVRDISARRAAEQAMRESEKRFRLLAAHVPADVWTTDTDLRLTSIHGSLVPPVERLDLRRTGTSLYELFATRDESHPVIAAHRRALGGVSAQYERTAGPMVIEGRVEPLRNGAGAVVGCLGVALDVTERRSARSAVRRLADFVESSEDAIITTAPDGTIETWNPAAERLYGYPAREAVGRPITLIAPPDRVAEFQQSIQLLEQGQPVRRYEAQRAGSDGSVIRVSVTLSAIRDAGGAVVGLSGIVHDITERKQAEEALQASETRFRTLAGSAPVGIVCTDPQGLGTYFNDRLLEILGLKAEEAAGAGFMRSIHPDDRERVASELADMAVTGHPFRAEHRIRRPDGTVAWALAQSAIERDDAGQVIGSIGTITDITELKQAEEALQASETRFRTLALMAPVGIFCADPQGLGTYFNGRLLEILGLKAEEAAGSGWMRSIHPDDRERVAAEMALARAAGRPWRSEHRCLRPDGAITWVLVQSAIERDDAGRVIGTIGTITDITERKRAEAALQASETRYRSLIEHSMDLVAIMGADGRFTYASPSVTGLLGYDPGELMGQVGFGYVHPDDVQRVQATFGRALQGDTASIREVFRFRHKDGSWRAFESVVTNLLGEPTVAGVVINSRDITERRSAEEALKASEEKLRLLLERLPIGVSLLDKDRNITFANPALEGILRVSRDVLLRGGSEGRRFVRPDGTPMPPEEFASVRAFSERRPVQDVETGVITERGETIWTSVSATPLPGLDQGVLIATVDLSERKKAEEEREHREADLREAQRIARIGSWEWTPATGVVTWSDGLNYLLGRDRGSPPPTFEVLPQFYTPESWRRLGVVIARAVETGASYDLELEMIRAGGTTCWTTTRGEAIRGTDGTVVKLRGTVLDITEHRRAEEERKHREAELQESQRIARIGSWEWTPATGVVTWSDGLNHLLGRERGSPSPTFEALPQFYTPESWQRLGVVIAKAVETGASYDLELEMIRADGAMCWTITRGEAIRGTDGTVVKLRGTVHDITERRRAEEALRRSEADYRGLVEHAPLGIYRSTRDGRILTVNPALVTMLGYAGADEVLGLEMAHDVYADPEDRARLLAQAEQRDEAKVETQWKKKDAGLITVRLNVRLVRDPAGAVEYFEGLVEDVTEQRSLENQFRQAQRLEAVGRLAGGVAHDFNNILTAISGYSELLLADLDRDDPKRQDVGEILAATQRAAALTRQLLAFSRKQVLQTRVLDLNAVIRTLENMLRRLIGEDVKLEVSLDPALGAVRADPGQIEQVVLNLAVNSRDAMPGGGRLTIETANVNLDEAYVREHAGASPGSYVMLAVSDTGVGMDAEVRSQIFEPFFTTKEQGKGTGLGLAVVHGIVQQSGGSVWVYSEPGRGATFKVYLPRVDEPVEAPDLALAEQPAAGGGETVLLAEDDPSVRQVVADVLTRKGYRVLRAPDGQTALEIARAESGEIKLLVTDIVMPGMTGQELAEALTVARPGVRVLYMSGYTDDAVVRHKVLEEGLPYLQKPFTPGALAFKVRAVLDKS